LPAKELACQQELERFPDNPWSEDQNGQRQRDARGFRFEGLRERLEPRCNAQIAFLGSLRKKNERDNRQKSAQVDPGGPEGLVTIGFPAQDLLIVCCLSSSTIRDVSSQFGAALVKPISGHSNRTCSSSLTGSPSALSTRIRIV